MNSNNKRNFEPNFFSQYNPIKKVRLCDGKVKPSYQALQPFTENSNFLTASGRSEDQRQKYKAHHKCKENKEEKVGNSFKAKPMPNFSHPFVPQQFKSMTTSFQEFRLSSNSKNERKSSFSRCETPESLHFSSFWSERTSSQSPKGGFFKARPMPDFSQPFYPILSKNTTPVKKTDIRRNDFMDEEKMIID